MVGSLALLVCAGRFCASLTEDPCITMSDLKTGAVLADFEEELTQRLHIIAVDRALSTFVHAHAERPDASGACAF